MASRTITAVQKQFRLTVTQWLRIGLPAAAAAVLAVLLAQAVILAAWPELASFKPLDNYGRSALFTFVPAMGATMVLAWLVKNRSNPVEKFIWISAGVLLVSFIPDYVLQVPGRTLASSSAAAFLHLVAGVVTVSMLVSGFRRTLTRKGR